MKRACSTQQQIRNAQKKLFGEPTGNRPLERTTHRWDNIKMDLK
jgi:hypothetical protein